MFINNRKLATRDFERYTKSKIGKLQFNINGQLPFYVTNDDDSSDHDVQICQDNFNYFYNRICRNVADKCPKLNCLNPIRPIGFCCDLCGSLIRIEHQNNTMSSEFIENRLMNIHLDKYLDDVNFFASRISNTKIEIIFVDANRTSRQSRTLAQEILGVFKKGEWWLNSV